MVIQIVYFSNTILDKFVNYKILISIYLKKYTFKYKYKYFLSTNIKFTIIYIYIYV